MRKISFIFFVFLLFSCQKNEPVATNGNITGKVTDKATNELLSGVSITINGNQITTGSDGIFSQQDVYAGDYTVLASKQGYVSDSKSITVVPEKTTRADFLLAKHLPVVTPNNLIFDTENLEMVLTLENKQTLKLTYTIQTSKTWITASPNSGTIEAGNTQIINISIDPETLSYNTYNETLVVNVFGSSVTVPITFNYVQESYIDVTNPIENNNYTMGETLPIQWDSNLNGKVNIELLSGTVVAQEIANQIDNNEGGEFSWIIPTMDPDTYTIRVTSVEYSDISSTSGNINLINGTSKPNLITGSASEITQTSAVVSATLVSDGGSLVRERGIVWSESPFVNIDSNKILDENTSEGNYTAALINLSSNSTYYFKAYAVNSNGVGYGDEKNFTTSGLMPSVSTFEPTNTLSNQFTANGEITSNGGLSIISYGFAYSTSENPTVEDQKVEIGSTNYIGEFNGDITGLNFVTTYYIRAYAINSVGISYGEQYSITTNSEIPTVSTLDPTNISSNLFTANGKITSNGGLSITSYGFVYSTSENPTLDDVKKEVGASDFIGEYNLVISDLSPSTTYYLKSYASNTNGTSYGQQKVLTTTIEGGVLVNEYSHSISSNFNQKFETKVGVNYRLEISGLATWGTYCPRLANDPAFILPGFYGVQEATPRDVFCDSGIYSSIFCDSPKMRPIPDVYDSENHSYDYYFVANSSEIQVGFKDSLLGDNCGSISFKLYENSTPPSN